MSAIDALGRSAERPARSYAAWGRHPRSMHSAARRGGLLGPRPPEAEPGAAMAAEQLYPRSSIEDDFNYGSNVASASVHIRMGKDCG